MAARWLRTWAKLLPAAVAVAIASEPAVGQEDRLKVTVDYVGVEGLYLALGSDGGFAAGDTLRVFADSIAARGLGRLVLTTVTRRRSVAVDLDGMPTLEARSEVWVAFPEMPTGQSRPGTPTASPPDAGATGAGIDRSGATASAVASPRAGVGQPETRVSGRLSLEVDARETHTSWTGDLSGETVRRFATPVMRLTLNATELPGGFTLRVNVRGAYRYSDAVFGPPPVSVRAYEAVAVKSFQAVPLELRLGRFHNPYEGYSTYWDGLLLRLGGRRGPGVGVVAGFEPRRSDEGFSADRPRVTAFGDFSAGGGPWRYDTDVSVHLLRPEGFADQLYAGWSQRLTVGPLTLTQRLRVDRVPGDASWSLSQLRLRAAIRVVGPIHVNGGFARTRIGFLGSDVFVSGPVRQEEMAGVGILGRRGSLSVDAGQVRWNDAKGRSVSTVATLRAGSLTLLLSGRYWTRQEAASYGIAPGVSFRTGPISSRLGYRLDRSTTLAGQQPVIVHTADVRLQAPLGRLFDLTVRAQQQFGAQLSGTRLYFGMWRAF